MPISQFVPYSGEEPGLSRRGLLVGSAGMAAAIGWAPMRAQAIGTRRLQGDLFAFTAPDRRGVVFAVTLPSQPFGQSKRDPLTIRLHAGTRTWKIGPFALREASSSSADGTRIFSGRIRQLAPGAETTAHLVAVMVPAQQLSQSSLQVWADVVGANGARARIGSPLISNLLMKGDHLAALHARLDPRMDRRVLSGAVARQIAERRSSRLGAVGMARAKHLASQLLPDTLAFTPSRPEGFTFAAMNGRRPDDAIGPIVDTLLADSPRRSGEINQYKAASQFPYFVAIDAA